MDEAARLGERVGVFGEAAGTLEGTLTAVDATVVDIEAGNLEAGELEAGELEAGELADADVDTVIATGEDGLLALARIPNGTATPVLPVAAGAGTRSVPRDAVGAAIESLQAGEFTVAQQPVLAVVVGDAIAARIFYDCMLVTAEPARISEFRVTHDDEPVAQFRADGVYVATPAGTTGYGRAAGTPVIPPGPDVVAVEPIAPFATTMDDWVLPTAAVSCSVERENATVDLLADDETVCEVTPGEPVSLRALDSLRTLHPPQSTSPFAQRGWKLEKF